MCGNQPLVSVIMPVYNCEKYVSEAIESVISQSYDNWELIVVDDGSKDKSISIIESYVEKDKRIRLYQNTSGEHGPGAARNFGMNMIKGKYTYFLDSDDWIERDLLQDTVTLAENTGADIVPFGYVCEDNGNQIHRPLMPSGNFEYQDFKAYAYEIIRGTWTAHPLIQSDLLKDLRYNQFRNGEDICFAMEWLCRVKKVCGIEKEYYHVRVVAGSVSRSHNWYNLFTESNVAIWESERKFLLYCGLDEESQLVKNAAIERYTWSILCLCGKNCTLPLSEKLRQMGFVAAQMNLRKYKRKFAWTGYPGIRKIPKLLVKLNLEGMMLLAGSVYFKLRG